MPNTTPEQRILKARALQEKTSDMQADQNNTNLESLMAQAKIKYPNLNWAYYDQMQSGIAAASTAEDKLNILDHFSSKLVTDITNVKDHDANAQATDEASALESNMAELKVKYPNLNWAYYDQMQSGLAGASTGQDKLNILNHFADKLSAEIEAKTQPAQTTAPTPPAATSSQNPPPKGAGFGPVSWNPLVINGTYTHRHQQVVIRG